MTAAVMRDYAETVLGEEEHLAIPGVRAQWPAMRECHDRPLAPIFVINLRPVSGFDCAHMCCSFLFAFVMYGAKVHFVELESDAKQWRVRFAPATVIYRVDSGEGAFLQWGVHLPIVKGQFNPCGSGSTRPSTRGA